MNIFLSYAHANSKKADDVQDALEEAGHTVWRDVRENKPGDDWRETIGSAVIKCDYLVILVSEAVVKKPERTLDEVSLANTHGKPVLAVHIQKIADLPPAFELS